MDTQTLKTSDTLVISFDQSSNKDVTVMTISRYNGKEMTMLKCLYGEVAEEEYAFLANGGPNVKKI